MMGDAVEQRAGEALAGEHRRPFLEWQVGGDDSGAVLVVPAEDVEQQLEHFRINPVCNPSL